MPELSQRVGTFTDSVIRRMTRISNQYGAINLSQGFPDFDPPKEIMDALAKAAYEGPHQYSITYGAQNFREALAAKQGKAIHRIIDPNTEIVVTCGGTEAMMCAMMTICNPGDKVMAIGKLAVQYDAFVVTDEVYEHMVYAPNRHICMASLPGMYEHTITCNSLSKTYSITGWRLGYLIGPAYVIEAAKKVHDFLTVGAAAPLQEAATVGLEFSEDYYEKLLETYTEKRNYFLAGLDRIGLKHNVPQGTYFVLIDISEFLELPQFQGFTDLQFCEWMIKEIGVAAVPGSSFFKEEVNNLIRLHFAREKETLDEALGRLEKLKELK